MKETFLPDLSPDQRGEIVSIKGNKLLRARLKALGLSEGRIIQKISEVGFGGPVIILINRAQVAIGRRMAQKIKVKINTNE